jgi:hypothetical protein
MHRGLREPGPAPVPTGRWPGPRPRTHRESA